MNNDYRSPAIRDLRDGELRFLSRERRLAAIRRAEDLLIAADVATEYTYPEIHRALTCQMPQSHLDDWISARISAATCNCWSMISPTRSPSRPRLPVSG